MAKLGWDAGDSVGTLIVSKYSWNCGAARGRGMQPVAGSGWVGDSAMISGRVKLGVKWGCGQWPGWAWDQQDPVSSLGLISSFLFGEWGKGIYNWTKKLRRLRIRGGHIAGTRGTCQLCWTEGGVFSK